MEETKRNYLQVASWVNRPAPERERAIPPVRNMVGYPWRASDDGTCRSCGFVVCACVKFECAPPSPELKRFHRELMESFERACIRAPKAVERVAARPGWTYHETGCEAYSMCWHFAGAPGAHVFPISGGVYWVRAEGWPLHRGTLEAAQLHVESGCNQPAPSPANVERFVGDWTKGERVTLWTDLDLEARTAESS